MAANSGIETTRSEARATGSHRIGERRVRAIGAGEKGSPAAGRVRKRSAEIIDAAAAVFAQLGYHGASTQDIATRLGIRQASLYYYFRSKDAALEQVCAVGVEGFLERARSIASSTEGARGRLEAIVLQHMLPMKDRPDYVRVFMTQRRFLSPPAKRRITALATRYERVVQSIIDEGMRAGELRDELAPADVMLTLIGACNAANHWQGPIKGMTVERAAMIVSTLLLDGMVARPAGKGKASRR